MVRNNERYKSDVMDAKLLNLSSKLRIGFIIRM